jgi:hypothetical protein
MLDHLTYFCSRSPNLGTIRLSFDLSRTEVCIAFALQCFVLYANQINFRFWRSVGTYRDTSGARVFGMLSLDSRTWSRLIDCNYATVVFPMPPAITHKPAYPSKTFEDGLDFHLQIFRTSFVIRRMMRMPDLISTLYNGGRSFRTLTCLTILELVLISLEFSCLLIADAGVRCGYDRQTKTKASVACYTWNAQCMVMPAIKCKIWNLALIFLRPSERSCSFPNLPWRDA